MSGHSKWANIRRRKGAADAVKGSMFTKLGRELAVAVRNGGADPEANSKLKDVIAKAKAANMPNDNIARSIKKAAGAAEGENYEEISYEGYGAGGVAVIVKTATDNRNRTVGDIRHLFDKYGGNLGQNGCVAWMFDKKGVIEVESAKADEDELMEVALEAGADDLKASEGTFEITTSVASFEAVRQALEAKGVPMSLAELTMIPQTSVHLDGKPATQMLKLMDALEDHEDVQKVSANFDIDASVMEQAT